MRPTTSSRTSTLTEVLVKVNGPGDVHGITDEGRAQDFGSAALPFGSRMNCQVRPIRSKPKRS